MTSVRILAIESSCDETAVAILEFAQSGAPKILCSEISSQILIHRTHGGVVPELASRQHSLQLPHLISLSLNKANCKIQDIDAFAATSGPGLASSLLIGNSTAKAIAAASNKPFYAINHLEGHLLSPFLGESNGLQPHLALIVSGGHTLLIHVKDFNNYVIIGRSLDDAAGEAFDKVGKMLGLPYPGGPEVEKQAIGGNSKAFHFPRSLPQKDNFNFSFSGLKTAVLYSLPNLYKKYYELTGSAGECLMPEDLQDLCASFQSAVIDSLVSKTLRAAKSLGVKLIAVSGGVSCNQALRLALVSKCQSAQIQCLIPPSTLTTDNAAMIAFVGVELHRRGMSSALTSEVDPNLPLSTFEQNRARASKLKKID